MNRMLESQRPLEAFAFYFESPQIWVDDEKAKDQPHLRLQSAWRKVSSRGVPVVVRRDGFVIFCFDECGTYSGGEVAAYEAIPGKKIDAKILKQQHLRNQIIYKRIEYMNAFLLSLTSAISTVHKLGSAVQRPCNPWHHLRAYPEGTYWQVTTADTRHNLPYDTARSLVFKEEAFDDAIAVMEVSEDRFGSGATLLLSMIYIACYQYGQHQFASAHMVGWCVVESLVNWEWARLIDEASLDVDAGTGFTAINADRRKLLQGRVPPAVPPILNDAGAVIASRRRSKPGVAARRLAGHFARGHPGLLRCARKDGGPIAARCPRSCRTPTPKIPCQRTRTWQSPVSRFVDIGNPACRRSSTLAKPGVRAPRHAPARPRRFRPGWTSPPFPAKLPEVGAGGKGRLARLAV